MDIILKVENIEKFYGNKGTITKAINNISFEVSEGEFIGVMGPSGSGKTTILNCISTIDTVTSGHVFIRDKDITRLKSKDIEKFRREQLGFIFQDFNLLDTLTAYENIALALTILGTKPTKIDKLIKEIAYKLNILELIDKFPYEMSGGERQRVTAARAIVTNPSLILADEPTGALDSKSSRLLLECLENLNTKHHATIVMVTHDVFTASYCNRILFIKDGRLFNQLIKGNDTKRDFFNRIIEVVTLLGGDINNVL
jgi:putative ABC transport system ATP-binding protein